VLVDRQVFSACDATAFRLSGTLGGISSTRAEGLLSDNVLPSTTRWKGQRDESKNIKVSFKGPSDLDTATVALTVTPPSGYTGPEYKPTLGTVAKAQGKDDEYEVEWKGPWSFTDASGKQPMPKGNYGLVVSGKRKDSTEEIKSDPPYDKVSLVEVKSIRLEGDLDTNPAVGPLPGETADQCRRLGCRSEAGVRIFAEARQPAIGGVPSPIFDTVRIIATVEPSVTDAPADDPVKVFFRAVDVDDPSTTLGTIDDEGKPQDNKADANAGLFREPPASSATAPEAKVGVSLDKRVSTKGTEAEATLRVSHRQGDNYRLVASTSQSWEEKIRQTKETDISGNKDNPITPGWVEHQDKDKLVEGQQVSEMLTVWRTLNLEVDRLMSANPAADQARIDVVGDFSKADDKLEDKKLVDSGGPFRNDQGDADRLRLGYWVLHDKENDWQGGDLRIGFHSGDAYDVEYNGKKNVNVGLASGQPNLRTVGGRELTDAEIAALTNKSYDLRDDELSASLAKTADYQGVATPIFARAYINVVPIPQSTGDSQIPFVISPYETDAKVNQAGPGAMLDRRNIVHAANYGLPSQVASTPEYWSIQLTSGFDGNPESDFDPQVETDLFTQKKKSRGNLGLTTRGACFNGVTTVGVCKLHATVFLEPIRDLVTKPPRGYDDLAVESVIIQRATAHEMLHAFKVIHDDQVMCANEMIRKGASGGRITEVHLKTLRERDRPELSQSPEQTCQ
jgi:hypothetical protein